MKLNYVLLLPLISLLAISIELSARKFEIASAQRHLQTSPSPSDVPMMSPSVSGQSLQEENRRFTYSEIIDITDKLKTIIGKGGFGTVYHGFLKDGTQVAVKILTLSSPEGSKEFLTEAELLMKVHHRNLTSFIGYCDEGNHKAIIYEYMTHGNLRQLLSSASVALSWATRLQIAVDAAQGLEYLHNGCKSPIIHRDVKTPNILLNDGLEAKLADFGLCRAFPENLTHIWTKVMGTPGYLDPEYYVSNELTVKSDIYSFGVVLLELITGQLPIANERPNIHIIQWVNQFIASGEIRDVVDPRLEGRYDENNAWKVLKIAMKCVKPESALRPTISYVLVELKNCLATENSRQRPWCPGEGNKNQDK